MALQSGAGMVITTSSSGKTDRLRHMGVHLAIDYASEDFHEVIAQKVPGGGVDVIIDIMGGDYLERNIRSLNIGGRIIQIGMQGERSGTLPMDLLLQRRLRIEGTVMKSVSLQEKRNMTNRFQTRWLSDLESKKIVPVIDKSFPLAEAALAHQYMQDAKNFGKIILIPSSC
jgi:NADPH:quinone reductase-like Zn-dependent oxidoreductase